MTMKDMENLILSLKVFKNELSDPNDRKYVNIVMRLIDDTIDKVKYYRNEEY